jgi:hypothetical protein
MSILISPTLANESTPYYALNGSGGGGGSGVTSVIAGAGIGVSSATGAVTISNTGVLNVTAGTGVTVTGTAGAPIISANVATGTTQSSYSANSTLAYQVATCPSGSQVVLGTITLASPASYAQAIWGANSLNGVVVPEVVAIGVDGTQRCYVYLSASNAPLDNTKSFSPYYFIPTNGTGETTVKLPSTMPLGGTNGALPTVMFSAVSATPTATWYLMFQNGANASNVYINAATSTSQSVSVLGYNSP